MASSLMLASVMGGYSSCKHHRRSVLPLLAAVMLLMGNMAQVAVAQNVLLPGLSQWAVNMGTNPAGPASMPSWGGLTLGQGSQGMSSFANPFQFGQGLGLLRDGDATDPFYGRPFDEATSSQQPRQSLASGINPRSSMQQQQKLRELQAALKGDPAIAAVVGPSLLLASSICYTVSGSLGTASTTLGLAGALTGNLVAWSKWINNAEIFFLGLRTGAGRRSLLEDGGVNGTQVSLEAAAFRNQLLSQLRAANDMMTAWGEHARIIRGSMAQPHFLDFLRSQATALRTARKALGAVQSHPLGKALQLGNAPLGLFRSSTPATDDAGSATGTSGGDADAATATAKEGAGAVGSDTTAERFLKAVNAALDG